MKPLLSIIIANTSKHSEILTCLAALEEQRLDGIVEVIVVEPVGSEATGSLRRQFTWIRSVLVDQGNTIPEMLRTGLAYSQGEMIAILEDHEIVCSGWCDAILASHRAHPDVAAISGPIENGCVERILDWATFFCEYCWFMTPVQAGIIDSIPGNNVAYKRWALEGSQTDDLARGFWENTLHTALLRQGYKFWMDPSMTVSHQRHFGFLEFLTQRFHYSRHYAGFLLRDRSFLYRIIRSVVSIVLPVILLKRILSCGFAKHRFRKELILSTPFLMCFTTVWAFGEMIGSLLGPGQSLVFIK